MARGERIIAKVESSLQNQQNRAYAIRHFKYSEMPETKEDHNPLNENRSDGVAAAATAKSREKNTEKRKKERDKARKPISMNSE